MSPSEQIDKKISSLNDWRGELYMQLRRLINDAEPKLKETWKWNTAVWALNDNVCALGAFKDHVKLNFFKGALIDDPDHLFNNGLDSKAQRSIDFTADSKIDEITITALIEKAVQLEN